MNMVKLKLTNTLFAILMVMIGFGKANEYNLTVVVDKKLSQNGKDLFLSCQVKHCCQKPAGWIKWTSDNESTTLFIDVKDLLDDKVSKYHGGINDRGFFLVVRNVSKEDIIMPYSCTYGFLISNKKMLLKADLSYRIVPEKKDEERQPRKILIIVVSLAVVVVCTAVVGMLCFCFKEELKKFICKEDKKGCKDDLSCSSDNEEKDLELDEELISRPESGKSRTSYITCKSQLSDGF